MNIEKLKKVLKNNGVQKAFFCTLFFMSFLEVFLCFVTLRLWKPWEHKMVTRISVYDYDEMRAYDPWRHRDSDGETLTNIRGAEIFEFYRLGFNVLTIISQIIFIYGIFMGSKYLILQGSVVYAVYILFEPAASWEIWRGYYDGFALFLFYGMLSVSLKFLFYYQSFILEPENDPDEKALTGLEAFTDTEKPGEQFVFISIILYYSAICVDTVFCIWVGKTFLFDYHHSLLQSALIFIFLIFAHFFNVFAHIFVCFCKIQVNFLVSELIMHGICIWLGPWIMWPELYLEQFVAIGFGAFVSFMIKFVYLMVFIGGKNFQNEDEDDENILVQRRFFANVTLPPILENSSDIEKNGGVQYIVKLPDEEYNEQV